MVSNVTLHGRLIPLRDVTYRRRFAETFASVGPGHTGSGTLSGTLSGSGRCASLPPVASGAVPVDPALKAPSRGVINKGTTRNVSAAPVDADGSGCTVPSGDEETAHATDVMVTAFLFPSAFTRGVNGSAPAVTVSQSCLLLLLCCFCFLRC